MYINRDNRSNSRGVAWKATRTDLGRSNKVIPNTDSPINRTSNSQLWKLNIIRQSPHLTYAEYLAEGLFSDSRGRISGNWVVRWVASFINGCRRMSCSLTLKYWSSWRGRSFIRYTTYDIIYFNLHWFMYLLVWIPRYTIEFGVMRWQADCPGKQRETLLESLELMYLTRM